MSNAGKKIIHQPFLIAIIMRVVEAAGLSCIVHNTARPAELKDLIEE